MRTVSSNLTQLNAKSGIETQTAVNIRLADGSVLRLATAAFSFGGNSYSADLIAAGEIGQSLTAATNRVKIDIQNVDKILGKRAAAGDFIGATCEIFRLFRDPAGTLATELQELFRGRVIPGEINQTTLSLEALHDLEATGFVVAEWSLAGNCQFRFKQADTCGYIGPLTDCNKIRASDGGCRGRNNEHHFGGTEFPDIQIPAAPTSSPTLPDPTEPPVRGGCPREDEYILMYASVGLPRTVFASDLELGDLIWNPVTGQPDKIVELERIRNVPTWELKTQNGAASIVSDTHRTIMAEAEFPARKITDLKIGEQVVTIDRGRRVDSAIVHVAPTGHKHTVIRIELESGHLYAAGSTFGKYIAAHNSKQLEEELIIT